MRDALDLFRPIALEDAPARRDPYAVLTIHRASNTEPERLRRLLSRIAATGWAFVFPVHPRTQGVLVANAIEPGANIEAVEPLGYLEMLALVAGASRVVTDSGGLQKEAYWLRVPCVTLRPSTEWVDTVRVEANTLFDPDRPGDLRELLANARFPENAPELYGDGRAAARIADVLGRLS